MHLQQRISFTLFLSLLVALLLPGRVALADIDFNNDGLPDLLFQNQSTGQIVYWGLDGATYIGGTSVQSPSSTDWQVRDSADIDGDGKSDLIFQSVSTRQVVVWYMDSSTMVGGGALSLVPDAGYKVVGTGDFNADGRTDLVFQNTTTGQIAIWFLNQLTVTGGAIPSGLPSPFDPDNQVVGVADFNGDGYADLVLQNRSSQVVSFVAMQGLQVVGGATLPSIPAAGYGVVGLGDFNGDGKPDLLFQNASTGVLTYWLIQGTTYIGGGNLLTPPSLDWKVAGMRTFSPLHTQTYKINYVSYVTTAQRETLTATFTQSDGGITLAGYQGYVRVHVTGVGQSFVPAHNDAFYLYDGQFASSPQNGHDGGYSQLAFSTSALPASDVGQNIAGYLVGPVPAYNSAHDYTILVNTGLSAPGQLHFGVSDTDFSDNTGAYTITVTQLAPVLKNIAFLGDSITQVDTTDPNHINGTFTGLVAAAFNATVIND
ncbi:MAG: multicopper oxidase, type 2, partial [Chthonomonadales bacterium]|nr:multicopper oxidase, type 2 [Chthonomonadales bacterium]